MNPGLIEVAAVALSPILTMAVAWGVFKARSEFFDRRLTDLEGRLYKQQENFVTMSLFNSTIQRLYQDHQETRQDIKRILELLSSRD